MSTLKPVILKAKVLQNGNHKIRIAVYHNDQTTYIITRFEIEENQFKDGQVIKRSDAPIINRKLRNLMDEYQDRLDNIKHQELYSCTQLKNMIEHGAYTDESITFQQMSCNYAKELRERGSEGYARMIDINSRYFTEYTHGEVCIQDMTTELIEGYSDFLKRKKKLGDTTNAICMRHTRTIVNKAIKRKLVKVEIHPFLGFSIPTSPVREADLPLTTFNKIRTAQPVEKNLQVAHDVFILSFYLGGINLIDLLKVDFRQDVISYVRTKTSTTTQGNKMTTFSIPQEAFEIAGKWMDKKTGRLDFGYKLAYGNFRSYMTKCLHKLVTDLGITHRVMYYSARKSFAQYASELGIPDRVIDYCLGHSDGSKGVIRYYTKIKSKQADIAIKRVIDYVHNPDKYAAYLEMKNDIMLMR